ncbi:hypothetical protein L596_013848 [Steinernema carpocapsae]|uniref:FHA domain-containing protein n=1 Tax=Steinernema carpocapsae TaxID=34508 RepID=A0A4U5P2D5_STECR|nr:hypothetical protein L596_013848 [Steinernema carpocapsae]
MFVRISLTTSLNWNFVSIRDFEIDDRSKIAVGRSKQCSLQISFSEISRIHCVIIPDISHPGQFLIYNRSAQALIVGHTVLGPRKTAILVPKQKVFIFFGRQPIACFAITDVQNVVSPYEFDFPPACTSRRQSTFSRRSSPYGKPNRYCNAFDYASSQESSLTLSSVGGMTSDESFCDKKKVFVDKAGQLRSPNTRSCPSLPSRAQSQVKDVTITKERLNSEDHIYDDVPLEKVSKATCEEKKTKQKSVLCRVRKYVSKKLGCFGSSK